MNCTVEALYNQANLGLDDLVRRTSAIIGLTVLLSNTFVLIYIIRPIVEAVKIFFIFVSVNDILTGFAVFLVGIMFVKSKLDIYVCVYTMFFTLALQSASQGNIARVGVHRYVFALSTNVNTWQHKNSFSSEHSDYYMLVQLLSHRTHVTEVP